ncbi:prepilin-type N-terminal cleavage/methylation domain-containing protein, partial [Patescibacteria group bacterium]|nr:prepilin-type N-terminal cleavage/methylation domain-containing protein [Patescibacteria group bacterium]
QNHNPSAIIMKNKLTKHRGFTLVETLFSVSIFVLILMAITMFARNLWNYNSFISGGLSGVEDARKVLKTATAEIRSTSSANTGAYGIAQATATSFTFYSDIDDNGLKEKIRYFLNGTNLQKGVIIPTGSPLTYNAANEKISTLAQNVTNTTTLFDYYDKNYDGTTAALSTPVDIASVRLIKITLTIDKDPNKPPAPITLSTLVMLRNLKDNL